MLSSTRLKEIVSEARPYIERQMDDAERIAGFRDVVAAEGGDWSALKALIKAQIKDKDERDDSGERKHVRKILDKAEFSSGYADMLGWSNMNEQNFSSGEVHDEPATETTSKLVATVATAIQTEIGRKALTNALDVMIEREEGEITEPLPTKAEGQAQDGRDASGATVRRTSLPGAEGAVDRDTNSGDVAQWIEQGNSTPQVEGSTPSVIATQSQPAPQAESDLTQPALGQVASHPEAKTSTDGGATEQEDVEGPADSVTGEVSRGGSARALPATSEVMDATAGETAPVQGASEATEAHNLGQAEARNLIEYDAETGRFTWRVDCGRARAGQAAGKVGSSGYLEIQIHGRSYPAHRLAWLMVTGEWPAEYVDHVDRDKLNNRWPNLRASSASENARNITAARSNNTSGYKGVSWHGQKEKWRAEIKVHGESRFLGLFDSKEAAARAYDAAAKNLHGEFANLNFPAPATIVYPAPGVVVMEHTPPEGIVAHPYAACWPVNNTDVAGGVREPIVKIGKMILDGRGRYFAARAVNGGEGIDYPVVQYAGTDPLMDCIRWNLASRTNLHPHNLRIIADKLVKLEPDRSDEIMAAFGLETVAEAAQ